MAVQLNGTKFRAWDSAGEPLAGGKVYTYHAGTNIPKATYTAEGAETQNANPVILNSAGYADIYLDGSYKIVVKDANDVEVHTTDPVTPSNQLGTEWVQERTPTHANATTFTVPGDETSLYIVDRGVKIHQDSGDVYGVVTSSSYGSGVTTVVVAATESLTVSIDSVYVYITSPNAQQYGSVGLIPVAIGRTKLAAIKATKEGQAAWLSEGGRSGPFKGTLTDISTQVAADPLQGVCVAFASDPTGASGGWVRNFYGPVSVDWWGADRTGSDYSSEAVQAAVDLYLNVAFSEGLYKFDSPVVVHDRAGLNVKGAGKGSTTFTSDTDMVLDGARIQALGFADFAEYDGRQCFFMITEFDGTYSGSGFNRSARVHKFSGFSVDLEGATYERQIHVFSSPSLAHTAWGDIRARYVNLLYDGWVLSDGSGNHYHLEWDKCDSIGSVGHVEGDFASSTGASLGTTWVLRNNSLSLTDRGYKIDGINYPTLDSCSCDVNKNGSYAYELTSCRGFTIITPGVETRYNTRVVGYGAGIFKAKKSTGVITGGFFVGGDIDELGTGSIANYGVTDSLLVLDESTVDVINLAGDWLIDSTSNNYWPWYLVNGSTLRWNHGLQTGCGLSDSHFSPQDTSCAHIMSRGGESDRTVFNAATKYVAKYETGSFTPALADAATGGNEATVGTTNAFYTLSGNQCSVSINLSNIDTTGLTAGNDVFITGLPYAAANKAGFIRFSTSVLLNQVAFTGTPAASVTDNTDYVKIVEVISGSIEDALIVSELTSGTSDIQFTLTYEVAP